MNIVELQHAIRTQGLRWSAAETSFSLLSNQQKLRRLGAVPPSGVRSLAEREHLALARGTAAAASVPASVDWRSKDGADWTTAVKDQGQCGSCVAFGSIASFESHVRIAAA